MRTKRGTFQLAYFGAIALLALASGIACEKSAPEEAKTEANAEPVVKTTDRGPVKLTVTAGKGTISIAERLDLTIEVQAASDIEVEMPQFGDALAEFEIRDFHDQPVKVADDGEKTYTQVYDLDIFLSGEYTIPGITAKYRTPGSEEYAELTSDPITITVKSLLEGEFDPQKFADVKPVATLPVDHHWSTVALAVVGGGAGVVVLALLVLWLVRRSRRPAEVLRIPAHEWALSALRALAEAKLIEAGRIQEFYYRLSEIARQYIERRFGLMAPERTTEEFLIEMRSSNALAAEHQVLLGEFLEACDMVKYARHEPDNAEIERAFNAARDFVTETKLIAPAEHVEPAAQEVAA